MTFPSGLKRICDISFYMTFASIVGNIFGGDNLISSLPIFAFVAFLSAFLAPRRRLKYISIIPLLLVFVTTPLTIANVAILVPAILFMIWTLPPPDEDVSQFHYDDVFRNFLMIFGFMLVISLFLGELQSDTLLFAISFLFNSIVFMRLIRHDESVLKQTRVKIINAASIIGVIIGAVLLSTEVFLTFIGRVINFILVNFLAPIFRFILWIIFVPLEFIFDILGLNEILAGIFASMFRIEVEFFGGEVMFEPLEEANSQLPLPVVIAIIVIIATIVIFLVIKIFKMLTKLKHSYASGDGIEEERFFLDSQEKKKRHIWQRPENQIREIYRRFLLHLKKQEVNVPLHFNSSDVEDLVATKFKSEKSSDLRAEYIGVRYGESTFTKADVKRIKGLYQEVKQEIEEVLE